MMSMSPNELVFWEFYLVMVLAFCLMEYLWTTPWDLVTVLNFKNQRPKALSHRLADRREAQRIKEINDARLGIGGTDFGPILWPLGLVIFLVGLLFYFCVRVGFFWMNGASLYPQES